MRQVATVNSNGASVTFDAGVFAVGGETVRIEQLVDYDKLGVLTWPDEDTKAWFYDVAAVANQEAPVASVSKSRKPLWLALVVLALLVVVGVGIGFVVMAQNRAATEAAAKKAEQAADLRAVYEKVAAVDSAVSVGINQRDYSAKVQDARAAVDAYTAPDASAKAVASDLDSALIEYSSAATEWNDAIVSTYSSVDEEKLQEHWTIAGKWVGSAREKLEAYESGEVSKVDTAASSAAREAAEAAECENLRESLLGEVLAARGAANSPSMPSCPSQGGKYSVDGGVNQDGSGLHWTVRCPKHGYSTGSE